MGRMDSGWAKKINMLMATFQVINADGLIWRVTVAKGKSYLPGIEWEGPTENYSLIILKRQTLIMIDLFHGFLESYCRKEYKNLCSIIYLISSKMAQEPHILYSSPNCTSLLPWTICNHFFFPFIFHDEQCIIFLFVYFFLNFFIHYIPLMYYISVSLGSLQISSQCANYSRHWNKDSSGVILQ